MTREGAGEGSAGGGVEQKWHPRKNKKREGAGMQTEKKLGSKTINSLKYTVVKL